MKKFLSLLLSLTMMLCAFSGCGNNAASSAAPGSDSTPADAPSETTAEATPAAAPADAEADSAAEPDSMAEPADGEEGWSYTPISDPLADTPATLEEMAKNTTGTTSIFRALRNIVRNGVRI